MYKFLRREILSVQEVILGVSRGSLLSSARLDNISFLFTGFAFLKLFAGCLFASAFLTDLFLPFVNYFINSGFANPYEHFNSLGEVAHFPYPAIMLYLMAVPKFLFGWIAPNNIFFNLFLLRLPIFISDITIFFVLKSWLQDRFEKRLIYFYWLSPVLFYISYVHGQLDVIPISLLFLSLYFLFKDKYNSSALLFGLALATKTNVLIAYPFLCLYLMSKHIGVKAIVQYVAITFFTFILLNTPFVFYESFWNSIIFNQESAKLFNAFIVLNDAKIYLVPAALSILFVRGFALKHYGPDVLIMLLGFAFSMVLLFIPPMQGWYFWLMPFLSYFYIKKNGKSHFIYISLSACYLLYFAFTKDSDFLNVFSVVFPGMASYPNLYTLILENGFDADKVVNLSYTALQATMIINCYWIYNEGLEMSRKDKIFGSPFLIGIGGNSGVGKSTISDAISTIFGSYNTSILRGDDMHKWKRNHEKWGELTHLDPKANHLHEEVSFLKKLKSGQKIYRRNYDHSTGEFTDEKPLRSNSLVIYEGLHPFYLPAQRNLYDLKVFIKPSTELMCHWKILRDQEKRGYSKEKVLETIDKRKRDSERYIDTQKNKAEFLIEAFPVEPLDIGCPDQDIEVSYRLSITNDVYIEHLIDELYHVEDLHIKHWYSESDHQVVELAGTASIEDIHRLGSKCISRLSDLGINKPEWPEGLFGVIMLTLVKVIMEKSRS